MLGERGGQGGADGSGASGPGADLHRRIDRIAAAVAVLSRATVLLITAVSVVAGVQTHAYTRGPLAVAVYVSVAGYGVLFAVLVLRTRRTPDWALAGDVALACAGMVVLPLAARAVYFTSVANSDFEPVMVSVAVGVALLTASGRATAAACAVLAAAYAAGQGPMVHGVANAASLLSPICWQVATACCCLVFVRRLRAMADAFDTAHHQFLAERETLAAERTEAEQRQRHFREQVRRHRALHDGPLRVLTAIAGPGPLMHPDSQARRQAAIAVNVLRGTTPDDPHGTLTDLSLALIEAAGESAARGLRVEYHFAGLPDDLPGEVVQALSLAAGEALSNVATHAGTCRARLTALATGDAITVAIVDQGAGFDPQAAEPGYGIRHSVLGRMREIGGDALIDSHPGQGTRVDLRWPR
jgi:signal transduction histidine kinase